MSQFGQKPVNPILNHRHPLTRGIIFDAPCAEKGGAPRESIHKTLATAAGSPVGPTRVDGGIGTKIGATGATANAWIFSRYSDWDLQFGSWTVAFMGFKHANAGGNFDRVFGKNYASSGTSGDWTWILNSSTNKTYLTWSQGANNFNAVCDTAGSQSKTEVYVATYDGANVRAFRNGVLGDTTVFTGLINNTAQNIRFGCTTQNNDGPPYTILGAWMWKRGMSIPEVRRFSANPWIIYRKSLVQRLNRSLDILS